MRCYQCFNYFNLSHFYTLCVCHQPPECWFQIGIICVGLESMVGSKSMEDSNSMANMTSCIPKSMADFFIIPKYGKF